MSNKPSQKLIKEMEDYSKTISEEFKEINKDVDIDNREIKLSKKLLDYRSKFITLISEMLHQYDLLHLEQSSKYNISGYDVFLLMNTKELMEPFTVEGIGEKRNSIYASQQRFEDSFIKFNPVIKFSQTPIPNHKSRPKFKYRRHKYEE